jgi:hypothetical protein
MEVISTLSDAEYERKNKAMYLIDVSVRERLAARRGNQNQVRGPRGIWREDGCLPFLGISKHIANDGSRSFMKERTTNGLELLGTAEDKNELENRLMLKVVRTQTDMAHVSEENVRDLTWLAAQLPSSGKPDHTLGAKSKALFINKDKERQDDSDEQDPDTDDDPYTGNEDEGKVKAMINTKTVNPAPQQEMHTVKHFSNRLTAR